MWWRWLGSSGAALWIQGSQPLPVLPLNAATPALWGSAPRRVLVSALQHEVCPTCRAACFYLCVFFFLRHVACPRPDLSAVLGAPAAECLSWRRRTWRRERTRLAESPAWGSPLHSRTSSQRRETPCRCNGRLPLLKKWVKLPWGPSGHAPLVLVHPALGPALAPMHDCCPGPGCCLQAADMLLDDVLAANPPTSQARDRLPLPAFP